MEHAKKKAAGNHLAPVEPTAGPSRSDQPPRHVSDPQMSDYVGRGVKKEHRHRRGLEPHEIHCIQVVLYLKG
jgi:hypothetical protein